MSSRVAEQAQRLSRKRIPYVEEYYDQLHYEADPLGGYCLRGNQKLPHVTINRDGYRGHPFSGAETILLLGDSVTFGVGASGDSQRFAAFLSEAGRRPVADASVRAYRVAQHFLELPRLLKQLPQTQHIILWFGYADLLYWASSGRSVEGTFQFEHKYAARAAQGSRVGRWLRRLRFVQPHLEERPRKIGDLSALVDQMVMHVRAIQDICRARNITLDLLIQPFIRSRPADQTLRIIADGYDEKTLTKCGVGWYEASHRFLEELLTRLRTLNSEGLLDMQERVGEADFLDQVHLKETSLSRLARELIAGNHLSFPKYSKQPYQEECVPWNNH